MFISFLNMIKTLKKCKNSHRIDLQKLKLRIFAVEVLLMKETSVLVDDEIVHRLRVLFYLLQNFEALQKEKIFVKNIC